MFSIYLAVTLLAAVATGVSAALVFARYPRIAVNMDRAGVPQTWMAPLGVLKAAGALGLLVGVAVPSLGIAAAVGLVLFFTGAIITHVRGHFYEFAFPASFLALAAAALALRLLTL